MQNRNIVAYDIAFGKDELAGLGERVQEMIDEGWQPYGSVVISNPIEWKNETHREVFQPMVKYED